MTVTPDYLGTHGSPVLITGGAGFIGSHVVRLLIESGHTVRVFELPNAAVEHLPRHQVEIRRGDIRSAADVRAAVAGCPIVLHLAANPNLYARHMGDFDAINHRGTLNVLEAAREAGVRRFVHVSTESILTSRASRGAITETTEPASEDVMNGYCRSKWEAELAARRFAAEGMPVCIASPTVPLGPGDRKRGPMSRLICQFAEGRIRAYLDGQINLVDVRDAATGILAVAQRGRVGQRYLLSGETWSISQLFYALSAITNQPAPKWRVPYLLALSFAWVEERYCRLTGRTPLATVTGVRLTRRSFRFDGSATTAELGLKRRPVVESLRDAVRYFQQAKVINIPDIDAEVATSE